MTTELFAPDDPGVGLSGGQVGNLPHLWFAEEELGGGAGPGGYYVGIAVAIQVRDGDSVGCAFVIAELDAGIFLAGAIVEINCTGGVYIADDDFGFAIFI